MSEQQHADLEANLEIDFSFELENIAPVPCQCIPSNMSISAVFRNIPSKILGMDSLGMGKIFQVANKPRGLILVTN